MVISHDLAPGSYSLRAELSAPNSELAKSFFVPGKNLGLQGRERIVDSLPLGAGNQISLGQKKEKPPTLGLQRDFMDREITREVREDKEHPETILCVYFKGPDGKEYSLTQTKKGEAPGEPKDDLGWDLTELGKASATTIKKDFNKAIPLDAATINRLKLAKTVVEDWADSLNDNNPTSDPIRRDLQDLTTNLAHFTTSSHNVR